MWVFVVIVGLLHQSQAAPTTGGPEGPHLILLPQLDQTTELQQIQEQQNLENMAVEQVDSSEESSEVFQSPSNSSTSLWLSELVLLGERVGERDREKDTRDDDVLSLTFHPLLSQAEPSLSMTRGGRGSLGVGGATRAETDAEFPRLLDDSEENGLTYDHPDHAHHHGYHGDEAELELGLNGSHTPTCC
ncbi:hypothetical protein INR49_022924 [Caranx melampygus]|nr:hypothetical protein INR49_022924 [Caranx melampygus]